MPRCSVIRMSPGDLFFSGRVRYRDLCPNDVRSASSNFLTRASLYSTNSVTIFTLCEDRKNQLVNFRPLIETPLSNVIPCLDQFVQFGWLQSGKIWYR